MVNRREERQELSELLEKSYPFLNYHDKQRVVTALLNGGYRNNMTLLYEIAELAETKSPAGHDVAIWLRGLAREIEDKL